MVDVFLTIGIAVIMTCDLYQNIFRYELSLKLTLRKTAVSSIKAVGGFGVMMIPQKLRSKGEQERKLKQII